MNFSQLIESVQKVISARSDDELRMVLLQDPNLLELETLDNMLFYAEQEKLTGKTAMFDFWQLGVFRIFGFMRMQAVNLAMSQRLVESEMVFIRVLYLLRDFLRDDPHQWRIELANALSDFSIVQNQLQKLSDAEESIQESLNIYREVRKQNPFESDLDENLGRLLNNLGNIYRDLGRLEESEQAFIESVEIRESLLDPNFLPTMISLAETLTGKGATEIELHKFEAAQESFDESLELFLQADRYQPKDFDRQMSLTYYNLGIIHYILKNYDLSVEMFEDSLRLRNELASQAFDVFGADLALTNARLGRTLGEQRKLSEGEDALLKAFEIYKLLPEIEFQSREKDIAHALNDLGNIQRDLNKFEEATDSLGKSLFTWRKLVEREPRGFKQDLAFVLMNLGSLYEDLRKFDESESLKLEALEILKELRRDGSTVYLDSVSLVLRNLADNKEKIGNLIEAENYLEEALKIGRVLIKENFDVFAEDLVRTLNSLGNVQRKTQSFFASEKSLTEALDYLRTLYRKKPDSYRSTLASVLNDAGALMIDIGKYNDAEVYLKEALKFQRELVKKNPDYFNPLISMTIHNLGGLCFETGRDDEAKTFLEESLEIRQKMSEKYGEICYESIANTLNTLGTVQRRLGKPDIAIGRFNEALEYFAELIEKAGSFFKVQWGRTLNNIATVHFDLKQFDKAAEAFEKALQVYETHTEDGSEKMLRNLAAVTYTNLGHLLLWKGTEHERENDEVKEKEFVRQALDKFLHAKELMDDLREQSITIDERNRIMQEHHTIYDGILDCYIRLNQWKKVLETAEMGKSRSLNDLLNLKSEDFQPKSSTSDTEEIVSELGKEYTDIIKELQRIEGSEKYLGDQLSWLQNEINQIKYDPENDEVTRQSRLDEVYREQQYFEGKKRNLHSQRILRQTALNDLLAQINIYDQNFPPKAKDMDADSISEISRKTNRTIVIFRLLRESTALIFVFPNGEFYIERIKGFGRKEMFNLFREEWFEKYVNWIIGEVEITDWKNAISKTLEILYSKLISHVHWILKKKSSDTEVLFVPNQSLALLPLHAASWRDEAGEKHYLLEEYTISYAPSISVFKRCRQNEKLRSNKALLITNPNGCDIGKHNNLYACAEFINSGKYSSHLYSSETEISFIEMLYRSNRNLFRENATKSAVIEALKDDYGLTHFACHGVHEPRNIFDSGLQMSDELITLGEIINCNLKDNWLTTLSACETGMVDFSSPTDEHFSLPLGFIFAGSPSVWASLWSVSDLATAELMQLAYKNLNTEQYKNNKPEALRQAQLAMIKEYPHPFFWAGFQHFGI